MELLLQFQAIGGLLALALFYHLWITKRTFFNKSKATEAPEPPGAWPIIGHLLQLTTPQPLFRTLAAMADKHGPAFTVRFGVHRTLVISNWELAKECFTINDRALASRPTSASSNHLSYDYALFGLAPYGPYWREVRKWVVLELLSNRRLESLKHVRYAEIDNFIKDLFGLWVRNINRNQIKVEMNRLFRDLTMNIVLKMVVGKRYMSIVHDENNEEVQRIQTTIVDFFKIIGVSVASDVLPSFLSWLDWDGQQRAMKKTGKEMDALAESWLQEHQQKRLSGKSHSDEQDFIDVMLSILEEHAQLHGHDRDSVVKATALNMIIAATDTTAMSLSWLLSLLLNHKKVLTKAQDELDFHVGKDRNVEEKDIDKLVYLQAIIKETLRLYPAGPLLVPHEAMEDCNFSSGFRVRKGTRVLVNAWKIHRDPRVWSNPLEFQPERFLTSHAEVDVRGNNFEFIPFGSGRRSCPGILFALQTMSMTVARLLHGFNLQTPFGQPVDLTEGTGLTLPKQFPLEVLVSPRLPSHLYD
ncbi:xanthotoxin 5-hydroxylase CYP82C2-like [Telopea speciosissima]|uniref:xanthotoxin 5-hydroxylase CYP82C2-like n=1 Tax=Telopea speciosissima TaxID=54955 RepID=UPI001CC623AA|nr:xanthotoxin 5-hydroxylase CYP82C2-like [Telopea speciosissima]